MKKLLLILILFFYSSTLKAEAYKDVDEFYTQCQPLIDIIYSETKSLEDIENMDTQINLMSGVCIGYFLGLLEGHQIGWTSNKDGEKFCMNTYNALELIKIFAEDIQMNSEKRNENLRQYFYNLLSDKVCS